jgi:hypothetical protein
VVELFTENSFWFVRAKGSSHAQLATQAEVTLWQQLQMYREALEEIGDHTTNPPGSGCAFELVGKLVKIARRVL